MEIEQKPEHIGQSNLRLVVLKVTKLGPQKLELIAKDIGSNDESKEHIVHIEGLWTQSHIVEHSIIHLINPEYEKKSRTYSVNNVKGLLVIDPDNLLTCTLVASSLFCERKTWLNNIFLGVVGTNKAMLVGTLVHEVFQYGVKHRCADMDRLIKYLDELLDDATVMLEIYSVEMHIKDVRGEALSYLSSVKEWIEKYMLAGPRHPLTNDSEVEVKVIGVCDIEENVWSTKYGLKGKIDVTGSVRVYDKRSRTLKDKTLPLELKTGNPNLSSSHAAQVSLYSMMIEDRYAETNQGLVIYLKDRAAMHNITLTHSIRRDLVQRRNNLNYHLKNYYYGPEMIDQTRMCKNCDRLTECILMCKMYENDLERYPSMYALEQEAIGHLDEKFIQFFKRYHEKLATLMTNTETIQAGTTAKGSFWTYSSEEAETRGTGFGKLQAIADKGIVTFKRHSACKENLLLDIKSDSNGVEPATKKVKINDYFKPKKLENESNQTKMRPFNVALNFSRCRIAISLDSNNVNMDSKNSSTALAIGFMQDLKEDQFTLKLYEGSMEMFKPELMYRVDKIEKRTNLDVERLVLVRLLTREDWRCDRVRQLILDPKYESSENIDLNLFVLDSNFDEISELDANQQKIVVDALSVNNYYVLTEKLLPAKSNLNRLMSVITRVINSLDKTVLIVAPNLDQLCDLMRTLQKKVKFIIIDDGKSTKARFTYASNLVKVPQGDSLDLMKKFDVYIRQHEVAPVVFTTFAMSIGGLQFTRRTFDYCIIYDCDKTELLISLAPMFSGDKHIIIDIRDNSITDSNGGDVAIVTIDDDADSKDNNSKRGKTENAQAVNDFVPDTVCLGEHLRTLRP